MITGEGRQNGSGKNDQPDIQPSAEAFRKSPGDHRNYRRKGNILNYILLESEKHNVYQKDIEKEFGLRPSTATEVLKNLEEEELIVRIQDEEDGRYKKIVFTDKAEMIRGALRGEIEKTEELLLKGITPEEQEIFMKITAKMLENLQQEE